MKLPLGRFSIDTLFNMDEAEQAKVCLDEDVRKLEEAYERLKTGAVSWSIADFIDRAIDRECELTVDKDDLDIISIEGAKKYLHKYDADKFEDALCLMIEKHDAGIGITWNTIDYYLDEYCLKTE